MQAIAPYRGVRTLRGLILSSLDEYKLLIDEAVQVSESVQSDWCSKGQYPDTPENKDINRLLSSLDFEQLQILASMITDAKVSGVHDILSLLNQKQLLNNFEMSVNGKSVPVEPFGTEMNYDFVCRRQGDDWPKF